jgi:lipopolysaccharide export system permease protein
MSELHQRLATPLMTLSFSILCAAVMLGGEFNRRGMTQRVIAAAAIIILLESIMLWLGNLMNKDLALAPAFYGLAIIGLPLGVWLLLRDPFQSTPPAQTAMVQL